MKWTENLIVIYLAINRYDTGSVSNANRLPYSRGRQNYNTSGGFMLNTVVKIYHDPFSQNNLEGWALVLKITGEDNMFYTCDVRFSGEDLVFSRKILKR